MVFATTFAVVFANAFAVMLVETFDMMLAETFAVVFAETFAVVFAETFAVVFAETSAVDVLKNFCPTVLANFCCIIYWNFRRGVCNNFRRGVCNNFCRGVCKCFRSDACRNFCCGICRKFCNDLQSFQNLLPWQLLFCCSCNVLPWHFWATVHMSSFILHKRTIVKTIGTKNYRLWRTKDYSDLLITVFLAGAWKVSWVIPKRRSLYPIKQHACPWTNWLHQKMLVTNSRKSRIDIEPVDKDRSLHWIIFGRK